MNSIFCPFTKGECECSCIFNNNCFGDDDSENCNLMCAVRVLQSFETHKQTPIQLLEDIARKLNCIDSNTGTDQTYSYQINNTLEEIKELLSKQ